MYPNDAHLILRTPLDMVWANAYSLAATLKI